jgi:diacylglycerol O-acyltransferase
MRQLSRNDALFLASESAHSNSNVSLIQIYDPSTAPGGRLQFKSLLALVQSRLHRSPVFRQKLRSVPLGLDDPYWVEDENFDLEYHVRHIALPKPGDWRQFCIQTSRIHARPLDLKRPLWELYLIEGLDSLLDLPKDSFALLTKLHHAAIDFRRGTAIITLLHDLTPEPPAPEPPEPWFPESPPGSLELVCRGRSRARSRA